MVMDLSQGAEFINVIVESTVATTDSTGHTPVDMQGFDSLCYVGHVSNLTAAGDVGIEAYEASSSAGTYYALDTDYACASQITTTTGSDKTVIVLNINKPLRRWHSIRTHHATQACRVNVVAIKYNAKEYPVSNTTDNYHAIDVVTVTSPTSSM